jgi:hypothetical protein
MAAQLAMKQSPIHAAVPAMQNAIPRMLANRQFVLTDA